MYGIKATHIKGTLALTIVDAKDVKSDDFGKQDPYAVVTVGNHAVEKHKTQVDKRGGTAPVWNEILTFKLDNSSPGTKVHISLYDHDVFKDHPIGHAKLTLAELLANRGKGNQYYQIHEKHHGDRIVGCVGISTEFDGVVDGKPSTYGPFSEVVVGKGLPVAQHTGTGAGLSGEGVDHTGRGHIETKVDPKETVHKGTDQTETRTGHKETGTSQTGTGQTTNQTGTIPQVVFPSETAST